MFVVLDFGSQIAHLIARRVRDLGVYSEIVPHNISLKKLQALNPTGIILSGGPSSVYEKGSPQVNKKIFDLGVPVLGICYGMQLLGKLFGKVKSHIDKEYGKAELTVGKKGTLLSGLTKKETVWMSHGDIVTSLPGFTKLASTHSCPYAAVENTAKNIYGVQFHIEVVHTPKGKNILKNFVFTICKAKKDFVMKDLKKKIISEIKETVGNAHVLLGTSGGVDSTVAAVLLHKAIGNRLHCVFIDHGLIRQNEKKYVDHMYKKTLGFKRYHSLDASKTFLKKLKGISNPEQKRKIIGYTFIEVFEKKVKELSKKHPNIKFLGQGTIYPDRIESAQPSKTASKIKSHHNVTLPEKMKLKVIEPLKDLYKDGVRALGKELRIPSDILNRHPFPGPGLAIRILGEITPERVRIVQEADHIFLSELRKSGQYSKTWQAFAALFPVKTVGVMGDARTYEYVVSLRAVTSIDAMTADWAKIPSSVLEHVSSRIVNEVRGVNRVVYDITQKPPGTIEYE